MELPRIRSRCVRRTRTSGTVRTPLLLGVLLLGLATGCSSAASVRSPEPGPGAATEAPRPRVDLAALPAATTFGTTEAAAPDPAPSSGTNGVVLRVEQDLAVYDAPRGTPVARLPATQFESPTWVPVVDERGDWARVLLPSRPNRSTGWVRTDESAPVHKARTPYVVEVDVDARRLVVRERGREVGAWTVGVGAPGTRTPRGRTFILANIRETVTDYSPIILPLGTHSATLTTYGGGPGTVALHGWPDPSVFGTASSDGCVRVPDEALRLLSSLPLGTLVLLR